MYLRHGNASFSGYVTVKSWISPTEIKQPALRRTYTLIPERPSYYIVCLYNRDRAEFRIAKTTALYDRLTLSFVNKILIVYGLDDYHDK